MDREGTGRGGSLAKVNGVKPMGILGVRGLCRKDGKTRSCDSWQRHPSIRVCVCVDVYNDVIPLVPGLSGTDSRAGARGGAAFWFESDGLLWRRRSCSLNDRCHAGYCAHGKWIPGIVDCLCTVWQENGTEAE